MNKLIVFTVVVCIASPWSSGCDSAPAAAEPETAQPDADEDGRAAPDPSGEPTRDGAIAPLDGSLVGTADAAGDGAQDAFVGQAVADGSAPGDGAVDGGATPVSCALPTTFKWTSGGPLAGPGPGWVSIKDFTHVQSGGQHLVYMTTHDQTNWGAAMMKFKDWPDAASAPQQKISFGIAPTLFYFTPKKLWVLAYQWGPHKFSYRTSPDAADSNSWSAEKSLYNSALPPDGVGPIDQTVICDRLACFLFYAADNGHIYRSSLPIADFPGEFPRGQDSGIVGNPQNLFEAVQVYAVEGARKYLMIVEAQGSARYFRAWTATELDGGWTLLTDSFATASNVTFSERWTNDVSHGDLVRSNPDETFTVDPCNLQLVFQGRDPNSKAAYGLLPYRLGLLTLVR